MARARSRRHTADNCCEDGICILFVAVQISPLPSPLYGLTAGRVGDTVYACGGFHHYYRWCGGGVSVLLQGGVLRVLCRAECYQYSAVTSTMQGGVLRVLGSYEYSAGRSVTSTR